MVDVEITRQSIWWWGVLNYLIEVLRVKFYARGYKTAITMGLKASFSTVATTYSLVGSVDNMCEISVISVRIARKILLGSAPLFEYKIS